MKIHLRYLLIVLLVFAFLAILALVIYRVIPQPTKTVLDDDNYHFSSKPCWFDVPWQEDIRCGELHTAPSTGRFILPVVVIRDNSIERQPDPVMYLQGGPGGSAHLDAEGIQHWLSWRSYMNLGRDLVLLEPRGVGRSNPSLVCTAYDDFSLAVLKRNTLLHDELEDGYTVLKSCFEALREAPVAFQEAHYGTDRQARDVRELLQLLHYQEWNLLGVSYGTRVALEVANQSTQVRSLILDSVYPAGHGGLDSFPGVLDDAFKSFFSWCSSNQECGKNRLSIKQLLMQALGSLKQHPLNITIPRHDGEAPVELVVNDHRFAAAVFSALYNKHEWPQISQAITAALNSDSHALRPLMEPFINNALSEDFNGLVFMAVDCRDNPLGTEQNYQRQLESYPLFADFTRDMWRFQACHLFEKAALGGTLQDKKPEIPALILAGEQDPITPLAWAQELHQDWSQSQLKVLANTGHAVINSDDCIYGVVRVFLDKPLAAVQGCEEKSAGE